MAAINPQHDLARKMGTPSRLGEYIGPDFMGVRYVAFKWILYVERKILEAIADPRIRIIILNVPPQNGKTTTFGMLLAAWYLGMFPSHQVIFVAYNEEYAAEWGAKTRDLMIRYGRELFAETVSTVNDSKANWKMSNGFGGMLSVGWSGGIVGRPGNLIICCTGDTVVETNHGPMTLAEVDQSAYDDLHVLSYDHATEAAVYGKVLGSRASRRSDIVEVVTTTGRRLRCTSDHPVWVEGLGYRESQLLQPGWRVRCLSGVRDSDLEEGRHPALPVVLGRAPTNTGRVRLRGVWGARVGRPRRSSEADGARASDLRGHLHGQEVEGPMGDHGEAMPVRGSGPEGARVLLRHLPQEVGGDASGSGVEALRSMRGGLSTQSLTPGLLLSGVRGSGSFDQDARTREQPLQDWVELHGHLLQDPPVDSRRGRGWLRGLSSWGQAIGRASHRPRPHEQRAGEPRDALHEASCDPPQVGYDTVSMVRFICEGEVDVYDVTVRGAHNFFANGVLVHNCDDLLKTMEEAASAGTLQKQVDEFDGSIASRLQDAQYDQAGNLVQSGSTVLISATRYAEQDLSGTLIERSKRPDYAGHPVEVINIPAIAELPDDIEMSPEEEAKWVDFLGRHVGEHLPGRYSAGFYALQRGNLTNADGTDGYTWSSLYQGNPSSRTGGMFPRDYWNYYTAAPPMVRRVRAWDLATTAGGGDWTVGTLMGRGVDGLYYVLDVIRVQYSSGSVEDLVLQTAKDDGFLTKIIIEQEKAGAGKANIEHYQRILPGYIVEAGKASDGTKEQRATPYSSQQNRGRVLLDRNRPEQNRVWVEEHRKMMGDGRKPRHDDQIDTAAYAMLDLLSEGEVDLYIPGEDSSLDEALMDLFITEPVGLGSDSVTVPDGDSPARFREKVWS